MVFDNKNVFKINSLPLIVVVNVIDNSTNYFSRMFGELEGSYSLYLCGGLQFILKPVTNSP